MPQLDEPKGATENGLRSLSKDLTALEPAELQLLAERALARMDVQGISATIEHGVRHLDDSKARQEVATQVLQSLSPEQRAAVVRDVAVGKPSVGTRDQLWRIVIWAFAIVLVGSFATLALSVFWAPVAGGTPSQMILTVFTGVVGFLAGLFTTSPGTKAPEKPTE